MATKNNMGLEILSLSSYTAPTTVEHVEKDFVYYGENNDYFDELIEHYNSSTTNGSIINGISSLVYGKGLGARDANKKPMQWAKLNSLLSGKELKKVILDRKMLGMAAMQITYNKGEAKKITHFPMNTLRAEKANSKGEIVAWYYHRDWANIKPSDKPLRIEAFGYGNKSGNKIYVVKPYVTGSFYYPAPDYVQALPYAKLENEIGDFLVNDTINGFSGSMMVNFNNGIPTQNIQREMKSKVISNLTGATGQKVMVNFNKNGETATTMERFALDNAPDHYAYLADECRNKLIVGHRITSPLLLGVRESGNGFGSNADEIKTASTLMDNVLIKSFQLEIVDALDEILSESNIILDLFFKTSQPLDFSDEVVEEKEEEVEKLSSQSDSVISNALIEKGEDSLEGYTLLDERDVNYEDEEELDSQIKELNEVKLSSWDKIVNLAKTGTARPNSKSAQDKDIDGVSYKVRYKYFGEISDNSRQFCKDMIKANKIYRKEDIIAMSDVVLNPGMGVKGTDLVNIWEYKGSVNCKHKWKRLTFASDKKIDVKSPNAPKISTNKSEKKGYRVRNEKNVSIRPIDMPNNGRHPNNPNNKK